MMYPMITLKRCNLQQHCPNEKWYCSSSGYCHCKKNFVQIESDCWEKIPLNLLGVLEINVYVHHHRLLLKHHMV